MEGYINLFECNDKSGNKPHFKGYVKIGEADHEFALWPAKSGKGFSGKYKPKGGQQTPPQAAPVKARRIQTPQEALDDEIPF